MVRMAKVDERGGVDGHSGRKRKRRGRKGNYGGMVHEGRMDAVTMATMAGFQGSASVRWFG